MSRLTISIAMCTYNGEKFLKEQLESIASQSRLPDELIVCDDYSSDRSSRIVERFSASVPFPVRVFKNLANMGSTKNFEQAITLCDGDIIALSDQDDIWRNDKLQLIEDIFNSFQHVGAVFSNGNIVSEDLSFLEHTLWDTYNFKYLKRKKFLNGQAFEILLNHNVITGATMAFRSCFRVGILPISPFWIHDSWIALLFSIISNIKFIEEPLIQYRQHSKQQIGGRKNNFADKRAISKSVLNYNKQIHQYEIILDHLKERYTSSFDYHAEKIIAKIEHLKARNDFIQCNLVAKSSRCTVELLKGQYHRYSNGYLSYIKDIITNRKYSSKEPDLT